MYSTKWSAISELVANGIDAGASIVRVYINSTNQKKSIIEIFDNGSGMNYDDLANKYAYIGRNKRADVDINNTFMGRKGVGKLAALFLSKKYYILSKTKNRETAWSLDSTNVSDSDMPKLDRVDSKIVSLHNETLWNTYSSGTMIQLTDVDLTNFAAKKLLSLQQRIANFYLLDKITSTIEVAHITEKEEEINFFEVKKEIAFKNFYGIFESKPNTISSKLHKAVRIGHSAVEEVDKKKRDSIILTPADIGEQFKIEGTENYYTTDGSYKEIPFKLEGWIGIHATIDKSVAMGNDLTYIRNNVYNPNKLRLYVRNKLAIENFLEILKNTQAFANYIEGEISFDILDDDRLEDISTTNRESIADKDGRITLLIELVKPIVDRLIRERSNIGSQIRKEEYDYYEKLRLKEEEEKEKERLAKEKAQKDKETEELKRKQAEEEKKKLSKKNKSLQEENKSLDNQNKMKDIILSGSDSKMQDLLVHELTGVSNKINSAVFSLAKDFKKTGEYDRVQKYLINFKKSANKLSTIKHQFLKLNDYDVIGQQNIEIKKYLRSYFENVENKYIKEIKLDGIEHSEFNVKVDIFELGVLLDNIILNIIEESVIKKKYSTVEVEFIDGMNEFHIISDTGPITISPIEKIFELGVSSKENGTGIGMYLCKEICNKFHWEISVSNRNELVDFTITLEE